MQKIKKNFLCTTCLILQKQKGYKEGWASYTFKEKYGHWPQLLKKVIPVATGKDVMGYIQHLNIRRAKI